MRSSHGATWPAAPAASADLGRSLASNTIHLTAVVDEGAEVGEGTRVWHFAHVSAEARVGARCSLGQNVFVGRKVRIGDGVKIQNNVSIYEGVEIADDVFLGPSCVFTNVVNPRSFIDRKNEYRLTRVGRGASIGANATIVCGHDVGEYAFVGAGAVVTKTVAPYALVVGNPARRIGWICRCGTRLAPGASPRCEACGASYAITSDVCAPASAATDHLPAEITSVPLLDVVAQNAPLMPEIRAAFDRVATSGQFILGEEVEAFEREIASYLGVKHAIGVSSGTDALLAALMVLGIEAGDEVVTTPFSFFATAGCIARLGARPVFVDIDPATFNLDPARLEAAIGPKTKAVLPVHLFGQPCALAAVREIADRYRIPVIEDAAQAIGAKSALGPIGGVGKLGCFSFFPSKNLGAFGDGGLVTTMDDELAARTKILRAHGAKPKHRHAAIGGNFRLDAVQAAILRVKLPHLDGWAAERRANAARYTELFAEQGLPVGVLTTPRASEVGHVWNQYTIRTSERDGLRRHLRERGIETAVYYPVPLHLQECFVHLGHQRGSMPVAEKACNEVLALPSFPGLGDARLRHVVGAVAGFLR